MTELPKAACAIVFNKDGLILAVSRKHDITDMGLPGGKVEPDETCAEAAARELFEETGLIAIESEFVFGDECHGEVTYWAAAYLMKVVGKIKQKSNEGIVRWVEPKVVTIGCFGNYNKKLFDALNIKYN